MIPQLWETEPVAKLSAAEKRRAGCCLPEAQHFQHDDDNDDNSDDVKDISAHGCGAYQPVSRIARSFDSDYDDGANRAASDRKIRSSFPSNLPPSSSRAPVKFRSPALRNAAAISSACAGVKN
jgi:hypothetical protein